MFFKPLMILTDSWYLFSSFITAWVQLLILFGSLFINSHCNKAHQGSLAICLQTFQALSSVKHNTHPFTVCIHLIVIRSHLNPASGVFCIRGYHVCSSLSLGRVAMKRRCCGCQVPSLALCELITNWVIRFFINSFGSTASWLCEQCVFAGSFRLYSLLQTCGSVLKMLLVSKVLPTCLRRWMFFHVSIKSPVLSWKKWLDIQHRVVLFNSEGKITNAASVFIKTLGCLQPHLRPWARVYHQTARISDPKSPFGGMFSFTESKTVTPDPVKQVEVVQTSGKMKPDTGSRPCSKPQTCWSLNPVSWPGHLNVLQGGQGTLKCCFCD